jgi:nucleoside-diphosphate-sugar epimerase
MRVLVTGSSGFVGRALCRHLIKVGYEVVPTVRRATGLVDEHVVGSDDSWRRALEDCETVVHLASRKKVNLVNYPNRNKLFYLDNVEETIRIARLASEAGAKRFIYMSTVKVNGEKTSPGHSFSPSDLPNPRSAYAISKWEAEQEITKLLKNTSLQLVIIRPPIIYGPGMTGTLATLIKAVKLGIPLPLRGVKNRRSMIAIENLLSFISICINHSYFRPGNAELFLVSDAESISTTDLIVKIANANRRPLRLFSIPFNLIEYAANIFGENLIAGRLLDSLVIDSSKANQMLGWWPELTMDEQLRRD